MPEYQHTVDTNDGGRLTASAPAKGGDLLLEYRGIGTGQGYPILHLGTLVKSHQARQLYHLMDRVYSPIGDIRVEVRQSRQEVTFLLRDEVCNAWSFSAGGFSMVHYIEPDSGTADSEIRVELANPPEDLQACLAAAIALRDQRKKEARHG